MAPMILGLTGAIGSGKSALAGFLRANGVQVINVDDIGHKILRRESIARALVKAYGDGILSSTGEIDRTELGSRAFQNVEKAAVLNAITHPPLLAEIREAISVTDALIVVIDAALFLEWGDELESHGNIVVDAPRSVRKSRVSNLSSKQFNKREACQLAPIEKRRRADVLVSNDGDLNALNNKALLLLELLKNAGFSLNKETTLII